MSDKNQAVAFVRELVSAESCYPPLRENLADRKSVV